MLVRSPWVEGSVVSHIKATFQNNTCASSPGHAARYYRAATVGSISTVAHVLHSRSSRTWLEAAVICKHDQSRHMPRTPGIIDRGDLAAASLSQ